MEAYEKIKALEIEIEALKGNWPAHSVPPALMEQLDELEERLEDARKEMKADTES